MFDMLCPFFCRHTNMKIGQNYCTHKQWYIFSMKNNFAHPLFVFFEQQADIFFFFFKILFCPVYYFSFLFMGYNSQCTHLSINCNEPVNPFMHGRFYQPKTKVL